MSRGITVQSGVGYRTLLGIDPTPVPIVQAICQGADGRATVNMLPAQARRVGLDLIAAATAATLETAVRAWARQHGQDGDGIIAWMKIAVDELLDSEGEPEAPKTDRVGGDDPISA